MSRYIDNNNISLLLLFTNPVIASRAQVTLACDSIPHSGKVDYEDIDFQEGSAISGGGVLVSSL